MLKPQVPFLFAITLGAAILWPLAEVQGQKLLLIEKAGSPKTRKIYIGDELTFKLRSAEGWYNAVIEDLRVDTNLIVFPRQYVSPSEIEAFRYELNWPRPVGRSLMVFGVSWSVFAGIADIANIGYEYEWRDAIISGTAVLAGVVIPLTFKHRYVRFGKRKRLRIVDLTVVPPDPGRQP